MNSTVQETGENQVVKEFRCQAEHFSLCDYESCFHLCFLVAIKISDESPLRHLICLGTLCPNVAQVALSLPHFECHALLIGLAASSSPTPSNLLSKA